MFSSLVVGGQRREESNGGGEDGWWFWEKERRKLGKGEKGRGVAEREVRRNKREGRNGN